MSVAVGNASLIKPGTRPPACSFTQQKKEGKQEGDHQPDLVELHDTTEGVCPFA
jgi:hypothetical protein